jgi:hypothetical protein
MNYFKIMYQTPFKPAWTLLGQDKLVPASLKAMRRGVPESGCSIFVPTKADLVKIFKNDFTSYIATQKGLGEDEFVDVKAYNRDLYRLTNGSEAWGLSNRDLKMISEAPTDLEVLNLDLSIKLPQDLSR